MSDTATCNASQGSDESIELGSSEFVSNTVIQEADRRFLRGVLATLIAATIMAGFIAGLATVQAEPTPTISLHSK